VREQIAGAVAGGVDIVQLRERHLQAGEYAAFVRECIQLTQGTATRILVNDRVDIALATGAHGVHLREVSASIEAVRTVAHKEFIIGRSVHDAGTAARMRTADYLIVGTVFETASKPPGHRVLGVDGLREVVAAAGTCPVWAVGGVTQERLPSLKAAGAQGVAAIDAFLPGPTAADVAGEVKALSERLRFLLDR